MDISISLQNALNAQNAESRLIERAEGHQEDDFRKVAKEMESLFAYQLLKTMRQAAQSIATEKKGVEHDTFMSLFDMEVSKVLSERGLGLQDAIIHQLGKHENSGDIKEVEDSSNFKKSR